MRLPPVRAWPDGDFKDTSWRPVRTAARVAQQPGSQSMYPAFRGSPTQRLANVSPKTVRPSRVDSHVKGDGKIAACSPSPSSHWSSRPSRCRLLFGRHAPRRNKRRLPMIKLRFSVSRSLPHASKHSCNVSLPEMHRSPMYGQTFSPTCSKAP